MGNGIPPSHSCQTVLWAFSYDCQGAVDAIGGASVVPEDQEVATIRLSATDDDSILHDSLTVRPLPSIARCKGCDAASYRCTDRPLEEIALDVALPYIRLLHLLHDGKDVLIALVLRLAIATQLGSDQRPCLARGRTCACATRDHAGIVA